MRSGYHGRKGIIGISTVLIIGMLLVGATMMFSFFSGGEYSGGLFGWSEIPLLSGIESFVTGVYNILVFIATWVTIGVLGVLFLGTQVFFVYIYYRIFKLVFEHKNIFDEFLNEITSF